MTNLLWGANLLRILGYLWVLSPHLQLIAREWTLNMSYSFGAPISIAIPYWFWGVLSGLFPAAQIGLTVILLWATLVCTKMFHQPKLEIFAQGILVAEFLGETWMILTLTQMYITSHC